MAKMSTQEFIDAIKELTVLAWEAKVPVCRKRSLLQAITVS